MNSLFGIFKEMFMIFPEAVAAGMIIAVCCSFLGVLVVLKRLVFIGATLSEAASCGIAAAFFYHIHPFVGAMALTLFAVTLLAFAGEESRVPKDAVMAALFILSSSLAILFVSKSANGLEEVQALLYGDLLITSAADLNILALLIPLTGLILIFIRPIVYAFVDRDEAKILGIRVRFWELLFYYVLGIVVSIASKLSGMLLVFCYLVVPPLAALILSSRLRLVLILSVFIAVFSTLAGFTISYAQDFPVNQTIAAASCFLLVIIFLGKTALSLAARNKKK